MRLDPLAVDWVRTDGEVVAVVRASGAYLAVNRSGATMWPLLIEGSDRERLVGALLAEYEVDRTVAERDVDEFADALRAQGLLLAGDVASRQ